MNADHLHAVSNICFIAAGLSLSIRSLYGLPVEKYELLEIQIFVSDHQISHASINNHTHSESDNILMSGKKLKADIVNLTSTFGDLFHQISCITSLLTRE